MDDQLLAWRLVSVSFNLLFSVFAACSFIMPSCSFFWYYLPSYWFYCNEWNFSKIVCCICYTDNKKPPHTHTHYRCKAEICFPPPSAVFFYAVAKGCIFQRLSDFNSDAKLGATPRCPLNTQQSQVNLFTFLSEGFQRWNYILLLLSELYYCSSILHFKNKTLILLWGSRPFLLLRPSISGPQASLVEALVGPKFRPPNILKWSSWSSEPNLADT